MTATAMGVAQHAPISNTAGMGQLIFFVALSLLVGGQGALAHDMQPAPAATLPLVQQDADRGPFISPAPGDPRPLPKPVSEPTLAATPWQNPVRSALERLERAWRVGVLSPAHPPQTGRLRRWMVAC